jgi:hypothetical protein
MTRLSFTLWRVLPFLPSLLIGLAGLYLSRDLAFINQGDFDKVLGIFFGTVSAPDRDQILFAFGGTGLDKLDYFTSSTLLFGIGAYFQSMVRDNFDLQSFGDCAKIIIAASSIVLGATLSQRLDLSKVAGGTLAGVAAFLFFLPHNSALFNTLYTEYALFLTMPFLLALLVRDGNSWLSAVMLGLMAAIAGGAKTQFFYLPSLLIGCFLVIWPVQKRRPSMKVLVMLLAAQAASLIPLANNQYQQANFYHSTYFGSYMAASPDTLDRLGLTVEQRGCVGVDAWGNAYSGLDDATIEQGHSSCVSLKTISLNDVFRPYQIEPWILYKLIVAALPIHATTDYFHVDKDLHYLYELSSAERGERPTDLLVSAGKARTLLTPEIVAILLLVAVTTAILWVPQTAMAALFLALFVISQIVVCLIGEGVRDLGRHLSGAQFAVDLTVVIFLSQALLLSSRAFRLAFHSPPISKTCSGRRGRADPTNCRS